uniref:E3 ubiquitin-protein ligase FANCL n=2 Tax=Cacopsylla melanoneura TaxID=428564 RepID=A0A8D9BPH9_9HEMI
MSVKLTMLRSYPLLIPNHDFKHWQGYVKIVDNDFKIYIHCPEFPYTKNVTLDIDPQLKKFHQDVNTLVKKVNIKPLKLNSFLDKLVNSVISSSMASLSTTPDDFNSKYLLYKDLETIRENMADISDSLDHMTLVHIDEAGRTHNLSIQIDSGGKYIDVDLPEEIAHMFVKDNKHNPVSGIYKQFCLQVSSLQALFFMCDLLDDQTSVLEPSNPTRKHVHRKIGLSESVAIEIKLNPLDVYSCPNMEVVGEGMSVASVQTTLEQNMKETGWDEDLNVIENLVRLLDIEEFPDLQSRLACTQAKLGEGECSICLTMRHSVTMETPVKLCSNDKCASFYHEVCLSKWLQSIPTSDIGFGMVSGKCPLCKTNISCRLVDEDEWE